MRVHVVASQENLRIARELVSEYKNIDMTTMCPKADEEGRRMIRRKMELADIILVIVDDQFANSKFLNTELKMSLISSSQNRNQIIVPIIIGDANIPEGLSERLYIPCKSKEKEDLYLAKRQMERVLVHRKYDVKKKQKDHSSSKNIYMVVISVIAVVLSIFVSMFSLTQSDNMTDPMYILYDNTFVTITLAMAVCIIGMTYYSLMKNRLSEAREKEVEAYSRRLEKAIVLEDKNDTENECNGEEQKNEINALGLMRINLTEVKAFYTWSQKQAKLSFVLAFILCILGFALLTVAVLLPLVFKMDIQLSILPAVGGVITELIAGTALIIYRNSIVQLNHYHKALHEDERFLSSVNLLSKFSTVEAQDEMLKEIIRSEIQMNILELNSTPKEENNSKK